MAAAAVEAAAVGSAVEAKPALEWEDVRGVASAFGDFELVRQLPSERDRNFLIRPSGSASGGEAEQERWAVLKVHNPTDSADFVDCQNRVLEAAERSGARCQRLLRTLEGGEAALPLPLPSGGGRARALAGRPAVSGPGAASTCICRLLTFLPGSMLADAAANLASAEARAELWAAVGTSVGGVAAAMLGFEHEAAKREFVWDLRRCEEVISARIADVAPERRPLLERFLRQHREEVAPLLPRLRLSTAHNDPNDYNLVVDGAGRVGVLDFGDMIYTYTCADAAICAAYLLFHCPASESLPGSLAPFVRSFHERCPLTSEEVDALFGLAVMRVCTSVCMSAHQSRLDPDNEYLLISAKPAWRLLERLAAEGEGEEPPRAILRKACGFGEE